jgi:hypothetical protein
MKIFERENLSNKQHYYKILIIIELLLLIALFYFKLHWFFLILALPILCIDLYSNKRCLNRQQNYIIKVEFNDRRIICTHLNNYKTVIPFENIKFSIREIKFEKNKTEIEIKQKKFLKSKLIGRLHIDNWSDLFEIKKVFLKNSITQVQYRPEGFWSKYGVLSADILITSAAIGMSEITGDFNDLGQIVSPISDIKESIKSSENKTDI